MKYKVGDIVTGIVTGIEDYGIFVSFDDGSSGLIHISEISDSFVRNVNDYAKVSFPLTAMIIGIQEAKHYKLSLKAIDYNSRNVSHKIVETASGFSTLSNVLDRWIEQSYEEITKKN